jgi:hypothetical protein
MTKANVDAFLCRCEDLFDGVASFLDVDDSNGLRSNLDKSDNLVIILGGKVIINDRQTFFLLRGALSCYIEQTILYTATKIMPHKFMAKR